MMNVDQVFLEACKYNSSRMISVDTLDLQRKWRKIFKKIIFAVYQVWLDYLLRACVYKTRIYGFGTGCGWKENGHLITYLFSVWLLQCKTRKSSKLNKISLKTFHNQYKALIKNQKSSQHERNGPYLGAVSDGLVPLWRKVFGLCLPLACRPWLISNVYVE